MTERRADVCPKCGKSGMRLNDNGQVVCVWIDCEYVYTDEPKRKTDMITPELRAEFNG